MVLNREAIERRRGALSAAKRAALEERLQAKAWTTGEVVAIRRRTIGETAPLSFAQERLWVLEEIERAGAAYNIPAVVRLAGALDVGALERAFAAVVERHEVLRTRLS